MANTFKVGDKVRRRENVGTCEGSEQGITYTVFDDKGELAICEERPCHCQDEWELTIKKNKDMPSKIITFVKNLVLTPEEKLLRKYGLKTECGDYTDEAREVVINNLCKEKEADLVTIAKGLDAEAKEDKE